MSFKLLKQDVLFYQRILKTSGFYEGKLDGIWGPKTNKADADFLSTSASISEQFGTFDVRSESNVMTLIPKAQIEARKFLQLCRVNSDNNEARIISGTRTYEQQDELFTQGRTKPGILLPMQKEDKVITTFCLGHWNI